LEIFKTKREKILFVITLSLIIFYFLFFYIFQPLYLKYYKVNKSLIIKRKAINTLLSNLDKVQQIEKDYREVSEYIMDNKPNIDIELSRKVWKIAKNTGLNYPSINSKEPTPFEDIKGFGEVIVEVKVNGSYQNIFKFLERIKKSGFFIKTLNISVNLNNDSLSLYAKLSKIIALTEENNAKK